MQYEECLENASSPPLRACCAGDSHGSRLAMHSAHEPQSRMVLTLRHEIKPPSSRIGIKRGQDTLKIQYHASGPLLVGFQNARTAVQECRVVRNTGRPNVLKPGGQWIGVVQLAKALPGLQVRLKCTGLSVLLYSKALPHFHTFPLRSCVSWLEPFGLFDSSSGGR